MSQKRNWTLRCVWVPVGTAVNAPLAAVWIQTSPAPSRRDTEVTKIRWEIVLALEAAEEALGLEHPTTNFEVKLKESGM